MTAGPQVLYECAMCHRDRPLEEIAAATFHEAEDRYFCEDGPSVRAAWYEHVCRDCKEKP